LGVADRGVDAENRQTAAHSRMEFYATINGVIMLVFGVLILLFLFSRFL
jgi:hypothetical protein